MTSTYTITGPEENQDSTHLALNEQESHFLKSLTGIKDDEELKQHIVSVQKKACQAYPYPCIELFAFTSLSVSRLSGYKRALQLPCNRPDAIFLDLGCCCGHCFTKHQSEPPPNDTIVGNILRKAVADGWPVEGAIGSDLHEGLWNYGHELFKSTPESFTAGFVSGDAFSSAVIEPREPFYSQPLAPRPVSLRTLRSLTPLQGYVSAINASSLFHLFNEERQLSLAKQVATLLSPEPGSIIFGVHSGRVEKGIDEEVSNARGGMFCHSPKSWENLWECQVFRPGSVKVEARLVHRPQVLPRGAGLISSWLVWSVTRL